MKSHCFVSSVNTQFYKIKIIKSCLTLLKLVRFTLILKLTSQPIICQIQLIIDPQWGIYYLLSIKVFELETLSEKVNKSETDL
jgi:hypothetical protein